MKKILLPVLFMIWSTMAPAQTQNLYDAGSVFKFGFARMINNDSDNISISGIQKNTTGWDSNTVVAAPEQKHDTYYVDTNGQIAFNEIVSGSFLARKDWDTTGATDSTLLPITYYVVVRKGHKYGVLQSDGQWVLRPVYDTIDTRPIGYWKVRKGDKISLYTKQGFLLPFTFDSVYRMDDHHFNVKQNGKWGVYSNAEKKLAVPAQYDNFDYCYGCDDKSQYLFVEKNGKWGVVDFHNKVLLPFEYDHEHRNMTSGNQVYCLYKNGQQLAIDLQTKTEKPYLDLSSDTGDTTALAQGFIRVGINDKYELINSAGKVILGPVYDYIRYDAADPGDYYLPAPYVAVNLNKLWGIADTTGKMIIPARFASVSLNGNFFIGELPGEKGNQDVLMDTTGKQVLDSAYSEISLRHTDCDCDTAGVTYFLLEQNGKMGFYNPATKVLVPPQYDDISQYAFNFDYPGALTVRQDGFEGYIDAQSGKVIVPPVFSSVRNENLPDGLAIVNKDQYGLYNFKKKKVVIPLKYDDISVSAGQDVLSFRTGEQYGLMDTNGKVLVPAKYFEIRALDDSLFLLTLSDSNYQQSYCFYNNNTQKIFSGVNDTIKAAYSDNLAVVVDGGKQKLWNPATGKVIMGAYARDGFPDNIDYFYNGRAVIEKDSFSAMIDTLGNYVIPLKYGGLSQFYDGVALMLDGPGTSGQRLYGFVDSTGKGIVPANYIFDTGKEIEEYFPNGFLQLQKRDSNGNLAIGLANRAGTIIIPPAYDHIFPQKYGSYFIVEQNKKFGILDNNGKIILPLTFSNIGLNVVPYMETTYDFDFPVLAKKETIWQYYKGNGQPLPVKAKNIIPFETDW